MKELFRYGFTLALICTAASGILATVNSLTRSKILAQMQKEEEASLKELIPAAITFEPVKSQDGQLLYYKAFDKEVKLLAFVFKVSAKGYSSVIETLVAMKPQGSIEAMKVINQAETPGL
ncbi:MAG: NADH:ubiquinone oxidoreductase, partial [Candidatus Omnitrophica bacterium]|nr:NADH:ubiquinone oxidoreductase [Candidatus Omnitrophota bacterium]